MREKCKTQKGEFTKNKLRKLLRINLNGIKRDILSE